MGRMTETLHRAHHARRFHAAERALPAQSYEPTGVVTAAPAPLFREGAVALPSIAIATPHDPMAMPQAHPGCQFLGLTPYHCEEYAKLFEQIRTEVDLTTPQCIGMTSTRAGEGTTTTLIHLAFAAVQQSPRRVLVVDANIGRPRVANRLGMPPGIGLAEVLVHGTAPSDAIRWIPPVGFAVLGSGHMVPGAPALLTSRRMGVLLLELKQTYDLVLVDTPHIRNHADAAMMSQFYDAVFLVVQLFGTRRQQVDEAIRLLQSAGAQVRGCILTPPGP